MRVAYERLHDVDETLRRVRELAPATVLFDVEPLVAFWDTDATALASGVEEVLRQLWSATAIQAIGFTTNSARRHDIDETRVQGVRVSDSGRRVFYLASARKPLRLAPYRDLPTPGVLVGDQIPTDGALACRLGYTFLHFLPRYAPPPGPRMMRLIGVPLRPLLFTPRDPAAGTSSDTDARA